MLCYIRVVPGKNIGGVIIYYIIKKSPGLEIWGGKRLYDQSVNII